MGRFQKIAIASAASAALMVPFAGTAAADEPTGPGAGGNFNLDLGSLGVGGGADLNALFGGFGGQGGLNLELLFPGIDVNVQGGADAQAQWEAFVAWLEAQWNAWLEANFGAGTGGGGGGQATVDWEAAWAQFVADLEASFGGGAQFQFTFPEFPEFNLGAGGGVNIGDILGLNLGGGANIGS